MSAVPPADEGGAPVEAEALEAAAPEALPAGAAPALSPAVIDGLEPFERLLEAAARARRVAAGNLWGSSQALVLARLVQRAQGPWLVLCSTDAEAELLQDDLETLGERPTALVARESVGARGSGDARSLVDPDSVRQRLQVAQLLCGPRERRPRLLVSSLLALLQPLPSPQDLEREFLHLQVGQELAPEALLARLVEAGYVRQPLAERPGEVSVRGDILDVFPFAAELPLRVELFDAEVESLRTFDPDTQRSLETLKRISLCLASDAGGVEDGSGVAPAQLLSAATVFVEVEPLRIEDQAEGLRIRSSAHARALADLRRIQDAHRRVVLQSLPAPDVDFGARSVQAFAVGAREAPAALSAAARGGEDVLVLCATDAEGERLRARLGEAPAGLAVRTGSLARGFRLPGLRLSVVNHRELLGAPGARHHTKQRAKLRVRALESFFELKKGDLVVHAVHGLGRFAGLVRMERAGGEEEHLHLLFADEVGVYVPASRIELVQRYIGSGAGALELDKIGGQAFRKRKEKVERALIDLAAELLSIQAARELNERPPWRWDDELARSLVASFPWDDTGDQRTADGEVSADLASPRPMDRLLCGDVGFGKTELAVRAAFRVASAGGQVAVLVPTTLLAEQHGATLRERLAEFPVEVAVLSRYVGGKGARETLARVARGEVDVLVGTHRILSKDVAFKRLGLVIIDEEQRFGVTHKEHFKKLRAQVDVLAMSATPIPRTLHFSLAGLRDISALSEPPPGRQEIDTQLVWQDDVERVREALLREKARGGQVFFLHNRVQSIARRARELLALAPECSFAVGHGQMGGRELAEVMGHFTRGEVDVLVATTIVENGIDVPSAGTILIDDADRFGLAELHQLRGRVGRGSHKAHCLLLIDRSRPMPEAARERLKALEALTQLGAGFQISMKDLELRGAGNILGPEQSGHIAAVGYDMYCRLLKQTVERMKIGGATPEALLAEVPREVTAELEAQAVELELGLRAFLPAEWIPSPDERVELLRKLVTVEDAEGAEDALALMRDRYGRVPPEAEALVRQFLVRAALSRCGVRRLLWRGETYLVEYADRVGLERLLAGARAELRPLRAGVAHLVVPRERQGDPAAALAWIEGLLRAAE